MNNKLEFYHFNCKTPRLIRMLACLLQLVTYTHRCYVLSTYSQEMHDKTSAL